jgi:hypothetical protein
MAGIIILLIFIFIVISLLVMPVHIRINPESVGSYINKPGFFRLNVDLDGDTLISVILYVIYVRFSWYPLQKKTGKTAYKKNLKKKSKSDRWNWNRLRFLIDVAWQSIKKSKLKKLYLDLDTSNVIINANLFPLFELINERPQINLNINYSGNFALCLDVQNNLWTVIRIVIWNLLKRSFIFTKNK